MPVVRTLVLVVVTAAVWAGPALAGVSPTPIKTGPRDQYQGSGNATYFAWTQNSVQRPRRYGVFYEPIGGGGATQIPTGGSSSAGRVDPLGTILPYHRLKDGKVDIFMYDLQLQTLVGTPAGINTDRYREFWPARYGDQMTFIRSSLNATWLYLVTDLMTGDKVLIRRLDPSRTVFANLPNLYDDYITWAQCSRRGCRAFRYTISTETLEEVPQLTGLYYFTPAVDLTGNVYLVATKARCGRGARILKWTGAGDPSPVYRFARGTDSSSTAIFDDGGGNVTLYVEFFDCSENQGDISSFANP